MLVVLQAIAFTGCVLLDMLPSTEVECAFNVPLVSLPAPPPVGSDDPAVAPANDSRATAAEPCQPR